MGALANSLTPQKAYAYCRALAAASPRAAFSPSANPKKAATSSFLRIADEKGIASLDQLKSATAALADPRKTDFRHRRKLIATSPPIYYFNAALHSDETGSPNPSSNSLTLAVSDQPMIRRIAKNLVVLINPVSSPDGRDNQVQWFYRYLKGKTRPRLSPSPGAAVLGQIRFRGHQSRRPPAHSRNHPKPLPAMFFDWYPTVIHDLHEGEPFLMSWKRYGPL